MQRAVVCFVVFLTLIGCSPSSNNTTITQERVSPTYDGPPELDFCTSQTSYPGGVTITGSVRYQYRAFSGTPPLGGLGAIESATKAVRLAEVEVQNSSGSRIQCGSTNREGQFSLVVPRNIGTVKVIVRSRAFQNDLRASIMNAPEKKQLYQLEAFAETVTNASVGTIEASAASSGSLEAGAFNILDQFLLAADYLRTQVGSCTLAGCVPVSVIPKVEAFWEKGFNPGSYFGAGPVSFYLPGFSRLFILGGVNGDVDSSDTDQFDNSVIIHEYGHFLEDVLSESDSPGGAHNGNSIIDPRLAWSEGWANFFQAAVLDDPFYRDTRGNVDGSTSYLFFSNLETASLGNDVSQAGVGGIAGEGNFREFSISRLLWDAVDPANEVNDDIADDFDSIWAVMSRSSGGWQSSLAAFRSVGLFHLFQSTLSGGADWVTLRGAERQINNRSQYAQYVTPQVGCTGLNRSITPVSISGDNGSFSTSDRFRNNDFHHFYASANLTNAQFRLVYQDADSSGSVADLDFYIYSESARFGVEEDILGFSRDEPSGGPSASQNEVVSLSSMPQGHYLINTFVFTGGASIGGEVNYAIQQFVGGSWVNLCDEVLP